ncbi:glycosyltransferase family 2 protein [Acidipropionibacterium acidipropionici]|uniref:glycosyltransferase family 2 protein n=1 Tax=Acidipropionibacterium acidipropionici TaxID=1748 RepID=UPI0009ED309E|nr:glycosyltransferase family A protein [Acidipropionibacterium acidipropionici]AZP39040.1 glycosyltransferase family 2 protein [Acidipropionibacterium acidipropionici]
MTQSGIVVVVPTLGTSPHLSRLFESLQAQTVPPDRVVVVVQGDDTAVKESAAAARGLPIEIVFRTPGLSAARNYGIQACGDAWKGVMIPDDDLWLDQTAIEYAAHLIEIDKAVLVYAGKVSRPMSHKDRIRYANSAKSLNRRTVWTCALEGGLLITRGAFELTGGFDENLGLGSPGPYQSGEGTDLLLRVIESGGIVRFDPGLKIYEDQPDLRLDERIDKVRTYARGTGRVYKLRYGIAQQSLLLFRTLTKVGVRIIENNRVGVRIAWNEFMGRFEGITGRMISE